MSNQRAIQVLVLAFAGLLFTFLTSLTPPGQRADSLALDQLIRWRSQLGQDPSLDPRLLILEVNEKTRQTHKIPIGLWLPLFAQALEGAFQGGASLVGFDIIPTYAPQELLLPFAKVALANPGKLKMVCFFDPETDYEILPEAKLQALVGSQNLGRSNLLRDSDGIFRRQYLRDTEFSGTTRPFFAKLIMESIAPEVEIPDEIYVNFVGPPGTVPRVSFVDVLQWVEKGDLTQLESTFRDKIVLVGGTASVDQDFVETPFPSSRPMPGVEMHANVLNTLLLEQALKKGTHWAWFLFLLLPVAWAALEKPLAFSSIVFGAAGVAWLGMSLLGISKGIILQPLGSAVAGLATVYLGGYLYRFNTVEREQRRIRSVFGRYVSPDVMEAMLKVPEDHRPELAKSQRVTVMFSDINNFSTACEQLEPEEVTRRLNLYFDEMTKIIYAHQGTIIRFIGDEFMVLFGAPKSNPQSEEQAVLSAVRMVRKLEELKARNPEGGAGGFYDVKIGIHVGDMILTSIGNEIRSDYNCIGDSTNMAARVLSLTKPLSATVLVSQEVKDKVSHRPELSFRDLGTHPVKGRAGEVRVHEALLAPDAS